jgi:hypothetical protein
MKLGRILPALGTFLFAWAAQAAAQDPSDAFFDESQVNTIRLAMSQANWDTIRNNQTSDIYYRATFTWTSGTTTETVTDVGVRASGGYGAVC